MTSKMKRFFSTSQKPAAQPYQVDGGGMSSNNMNGNPVPSMANLNLHSGGRSRTPPPPPIFAGYVGTPGIPNGPPAFGNPGANSTADFFANGGMPLHQQQHQQHPLQQTAPSHFPPPGAFYNGVDVGATGGGGHGYNSSSMGSFGGPMGTAPRGFSGSVNGVNAINGANGVNGYNGGSVNGNIVNGNINGGVNGNASGNQYGEVSFLNQMPPPPNDARGLASPVGSVHSQANSSNANVNNIPPPPRSAGTTSAASQPSGAYPPSQVFPTPPQQHAQPHHPQHQPSYNSLYQQQQQQQQQQNFAGSNAPFPPRQQQQQTAAPPPPQPAAKTHRSLLSSKPKNGNPGPPPNAPNSYQQHGHPQQQQQQARRQQQNPPPGQPMSSQQHAMTNVAVTATDIRDTTYMLRQLYKMELFIHGERYAIHEDDQSERREMRRKADLLREEIENNVNTWRMTGGANWTPEEKQHVEYSVQLIGTLRTLGQGDDA
ncbi:hypothetical protein SEUCBS139899_003975 [Sporothrix eucalyptigena]|uniref:Uncharacterized protein n=1 Tax=Sporothrix eucalyptigena TaxID=1812306 RepID=A0ABP0AJY7_9PEZI